MNTQTHRAATRARGFRGWPLSVKVMISLTGALLPLGVLATLTTASAYHQILAESGAVSVASWIGLALPLLMWLAALLIGWLIANQMLVRPLTQMRSAVERFRLGDTSVRLGKTDYFSAEMTELAAAFDAMAEEGARHEGAMGDALDEQRRLTREVHHRVKNNLQIVASLLSIQARDTSSAEVARAYAAVQARVDALALVHRWMYDDETARGVNLHALATDLCASLEQSIAAHEGVAPRLRCHVDSFPVAQDTAVPVAFLITEFVTLAARLAAPVPAEVLISATTDAAVARLCIASPVFATDVLAGPASPTVRIILGMARQMRAPLRHDPADRSFSIEFGVPV